MDFVEVVESRRSVRVYDGSPIPIDVVNKCLDLALLAPNSSNLQPWEFLWIKNKEKKDKVIEACFSQPAAKTAAELIVCIANTSSWKQNRDLMLKKLSEAEDGAPAFAQAYYKKLVPFVYTQGPFGVFGFFKKILFFFGGFFKPVPREPTSISELKLWAVKSTALACENLMLAFRAFGYDTCPMEGYDSRRVKRVLGLSRHQTLVMIVSAGKRKEKGIYGPRIRFDREKFVKEI